MTFDVRSSKELFSPQFLGVFIILCFRTFSAAMKSLEMAPRFSSTRFKSRRADLKTFALLSISDREQTKNIFAAVKADFFQKPLI